MDINEIKDVIIHSVDSLTEKDYAFLNTHSDLPLTSIEIGLTFIEMMYLFMDIVRRFPDIKFEKEDFYNYGFNSIDNISTLIHYKTLSHPSMKYK